MAKFLTTAGTVSSIENIIRRASARLILVSPYLKLSKQFERRLIDANKRKVQIVIVYGKEPLVRDEIEKLLVLEHLQLLYCENLHAKCYVNDDKMVLSSMNLYEFSERNNREMGIMLSKFEDSEAFDDVLDEIESIINSSDTIKEKLFYPCKKNSFVGVSISHLIVLKSILEESYPEQPWQIEKSCIKCAFKEGVRLYIDHRVIFRFDSNTLLSNLREVLEQTVFIDRCFWHGKAIYYNLPQEFFPIFHEDDQVYVSHYLLKFIKEVDKLIDYLVDSSSN
ncbi:phospholipase D family protein [Sphingobacterium siyangense]|uniref:phospholipase D family protein n=1 Tax=Sphingobacterium siyangense TaxID=459529 RepID=UPI003C76ACED